MFSRRYIEKLEKLEHQHGHVATPGHQHPPTVAAVAVTAEPNGDTPADSSTRNNRASSSSSSSKTDATNSKTKKKQQ